MSRRITTALAQAPASSLLTLTSNPKAYPDPEAAFRALSGAFNMLCKRIRRRLKDRPFEFFLVWEITRAGWPHAHVILQSPFLPQRWLSKQWSELTGSPVVDVRKISPGPGAARYVAKYLTKALSCPPRMKRYRASREFFGHHSLSEILRPKTDSTWRVAKTSTLELAREFAFRGDHIHLDNDGRLTASRHHPPGCICGYTLLRTPPPPLTSRIAA